MIQQQVTKYTSRRRTISKSAHHTDMWIIEDGKGKFSTINASTDVMLRMNPPDKPFVLLRSKPLNLN